jgi:hypothetical protein
MREPEGLKGKSLLIAEREGQPDGMWTYWPEARRVRQLLPVESYASFLDTDFTYGDLGFVNRKGSYIYRGEKTFEGNPAYQIVLASKERRYYSRIVIWLAKDSLLPLQREYYDPQGKRWRTERFEKVSVINGVPTPLLIRMENHRANTVSEFRVSEVRYDGSLPDELFDPRRLSQAAAAPVWQSMSQAAANR